MVATIQGVEAKRPDVNLNCTLNLQRLFKAAGLSSVLIELLGDIHVHSISLPIEVEMPTVDIRPAANSQLGEEAHSSAISTLRWQRTWQNAVDQVQKILFEIPQRRI